MSNEQSRTKSIARIALTIALMAVSAWITVPLGPVPFTLQCFAMAFAVCVLPAKESMCAIGGYLLLGAFGVPVFSGMRGGIAVLAGVTGGFLWGYFLGICAGALLILLFKKFNQDRTLVACICAGLAYLLITYVCGCIQFMGVTGSSLQATLAACVAPFVVVDLIKISCAAVVARAVEKALSLNRSSNLKQRG